MQLLQEVEAIVMAMGKRCGAPLADAVHGEDCG